MVLEFLHILHISNVSLSYRKRSSSEGRRGEGEAERAIGRGRDGERGREGEGVGCRRYLLMICQRQDCEPVQAQFL